MNSATARATPMPLVALCACAFALASCQTMKDTSDAIFGGGGNPPPATGATALEAELKPVASAVGGAVLFRARSGGVTMIVHLSNLPTGSVRVVIHANGSCSSPNGFSAGPPWAPEGMRVPIPDQTLRGSTSGNADLTVRIDGITLEGPQGISGRSVVVHDDTSRSLEAEPGVRNNRIACGVIGPLRPGFL